MTQPSILVGIVGIEPTQNLVPKTSAVPLGHIPKLNNGVERRIRTFGPRKVDSLANCWFKPLTHFNINKQEQSQESVSTKENFESSLRKKGKKLS